MARESFPDEQQSTSNGMPDEAAMDRAWEQFLESGEDRPPQAEVPTIPETEAEVVIRAPLASEVEVKTVKEMVSDPPVPKQLRLRYP